MRLVDRAHVALLAEGVAVVGREHDRRRAVAEGRGVADEDGRARVDRADRARVGAGAFRQLEARPQGGLGVLLLEHAVPLVAVLAGVGEVRARARSPRPGRGRAPTGRWRPRTRSPGCRCRSSSGCPMPRLGQRERPVLAAVGGAPDAGRGCRGSRRRRWRSRRSAGWRARSVTGDQVAPPSVVRSSEPPMAVVYGPPAIDWPPPLLAAVGRDRVAEGGRDEVDRAELALARLGQRRPAGAAVDGAQQRAAAGRPAVLAVDEVDLVEVGRARVLPGPAGAAVAGGHDPARARDPAVAGVGELDGRQGRGLAGRRMPGGVVAVAEAPARWRRMRLARATLLTASSARARGARR